MDLQIIRVSCRGAVPFCLPEKVLERCQYYRQRRPFEGVSAPGWLDIGGNWAYPEVTSVLELFIKGKIRGDSPASTFD